MTTVKVATTNVVKIDAIKEVFERYFDDISYSAINVDSKVPSQPINEDVFKGAQNRLEGLKTGCITDYLVACEGGLLNLYGDWFNVQVIRIERKDGKVGIGLSQGFQIPPEYVDEAINTNIANVLDRIFEGKGGIRVLTKNHFTRKDLISDATTMALTRLLNGVAW